MGQDVAVCFVPGAPDEGQLLEAARKKLPRDPDVAFAALFRPFGKLTAISIFAEKDDSFTDVPLDDFLIDFSRRIAPKRLLVAYYGEHSGVSGWTALENGEIVEEDAREDGGEPAIPATAFDMAFGSRTEAGDIDTLVQGTSGVVLAPSAR